VKRAAALGSIQQEHFHFFMHCLAAKDNRGGALTRAVILALLRMEAEVRSGLGPHTGASRIRRPHDMVLLKPAEAAEVMCFGDIVRRVIVAMDADGLKMS
jgi:hypothetical protein